MAPPKYICNDCRQPLEFYEQDGVFKFAHRSRSQDAACDAEIARKKALEVAKALEATAAEDCPPAEVEISPGVFELE